MEENYEVINITEYLSYDHFKNICFINESLETQYNKNGINSFSQYLRYDTYPLVYTKNSDKNKLKEELISKFKNVESHLIILDNLFKVKISSLKSPSNRPNTLNHSPSWSLMLSSK